MKASIFITILSCVVLATAVQCKREIDNPYDSATPSELWTPQSFKAEQSGNNVVLSWVQDITHIDGFKLERRVSQGNWANIATLGEGVTSYTDADLVGGVVHEYRLYAFAGNNQSGILTAQITPLFVDGTTGNVSHFGYNYKTVWIGGREWMAENLQTPRYRNGDVINALINTQWAIATAGARAVYPHTEFTGFSSTAAVLAAYGALYNWHAVADSRGLCPPGWHVPATSEWDALVDHLGGTTLAGGKLKSPRTAPIAHPRWDSPNTGATNSSGFTALPAGARSIDGSYALIGGGALWWSSTQQDAPTAFAFVAAHNSEHTGRGNLDKKFGFSVRCVKDR